MKLLKVYWTSTAVKQRNYIFKYWNKRNKNTSFSNRLNARIQERVKLLKTYPFLGKITVFKNTRTVSLGHYSIFYKPTESSIIITGFWDNRQDPKNLILFLKNK